MMDENAHDMRAGQLSIRVRYSECDPMGVAHHTTYPVWFEMGRTELLRASDRSYRDYEAEGVFLAVVALEVSYKKPALYDDLLELESVVSEISHVKIIHEYTLRRNGELLATGKTTLACLDRDGKLRPVPDSLRV